MRFTLSLPVVLCVFCGMAFAQSPAAHAPLAMTEEVAAPRAEVFGGFTYQHRQNGMSLAGWNAAVNFNFTPRFGLVADTARQSPAFAFLTNADTANRYSFLLGPQVSFRGDRWIAFARGLAGTHYYTGQPRVNGGWNFAYGFGGGIDLGLTDRFAVRPLQWDYIIIDGRNSHLSAQRISLGAVVRF